MALSRTKYLSAKGREKGVRKALHHSNLRMEKRLEG